MAVSLQRAGAGVEPPHSQLLLSKHTRHSQEQHVSQPGKKGQVEEPLDGQNDPYRQRGKGTGRVCARERERDRIQPRKSEREQKRKTGRECQHVFHASQIRGAPRSFDVMLMVVG